MKLERLAKSAVAGATALLVAACGGGGGGEADAGKAPVLKLSGTAATGLALADSAVEVKCAKGAGTATTDANGAYTLAITDAALPCIVKVTGTAGGVTVTLHSVAESGTTGTEGTSAVANVTPLTEIVVAQLTAALPADIFAAFGADSGAQITKEKLAAATVAVLAALKDATGIDLGAIDPFKTELVAATSSAPAAGNDYDKLLDQLGTKVSVESLPQVVNQVAAGAASGGSAGLTDAMASVEAGALASCPAAMSGKYRFVDFFGKSYVRELDFKAMRFRQVGASGGLPITADSTKPCEFVSEGNNGSIDVKFEFVMGPSGVGTYRIQNFTDNRSIIGYVFPVQSHAVAALAGEWSFLQSGYMPGDGLVHWPGKLTFGSDNKVGVCEYNSSTWACEPDPEANLSVAARDDGGFDFNEADEPGVANVYGYRAPNGSLTVFGTTNAAGTNTNETEQSVIVASKLGKLKLPAVGDVVKYWDLSLTQNGSNRTVLSPAQDATTVQTVDAGTGVVTRKRTSDGREDLVRYNHPIDGVRARDAGTWNSVPFAPVLQMPLTGVGITLSVNTVPYPTGAYIYNLSVSRP
jgi:hypothetical protein